MKLSELLKNELIERLKSLKLEKVILFGSYAWGEPNDESDVDLYVVTQDTFMPKNFSEKMEVKLSVARQLADFRKKFATDLVVHTIPMHRKFVELNSSFAREVMSKGVVLL